MVKKDLKAKLVTGKEGLDNFYPLIENRRLSLLSLLYASPLIFLPELNSMCTYRLRNMSDAILWICYSYINTFFSLFIFHNSIA